MDISTRISLEYLSLSWDDKNYPLDNIGGKRYLRDIFCYPRIRKDISGKYHTYTAVTAYLKSKLVEWYAAAPKSDCHAPAQEELWRMTERSPRQGKRGKGERGERAQCPRCLPWICLECSELIPRWG